MTSWGCCRPRRSGLWLPLVCRRQLDSARLVAALRQIGVPLAQITVILTLAPDAAAARRRVLVRG